MTSLQVFSYHVESENFVSAHGVELRLTRTHAVPIITGGLMSHEEELRTMIKKVKYILPLFLLLYYPSTVSANLKLHRCEQKSEE